MNATMSTPYQMQKERDERQRADSQPIVWAWAVWRAQRDDRLARPRASIPLFCIWYGVLIVVFINGDRAFP